eukprot:GHUV01041826.1.p2 GENE.GHUV01041826.1~~GHUV01041826.1.p2  ORF type:complete len:113 (-),score=29.54 GHUV01041826.1:271-609(-)
MAGPDCLGEPAKHPNEAVFACSCLIWCCLVAYRQGIIFLILNYNHIRTVLREADSSAAQRLSSSSGNGAGSRQQQQQPPLSPNGRATIAGGLGSAGAAAIKECEVRRDSMAG